MEEEKKPHFLLAVLRKPRVKQLLVAGCSVISIILFFVAPANNTWLREKILAPLQDIKTEHTKMGLEQRMEYRFDSDYIYSEQIALLFEKKGIKKTALALMPPTSYFKLKNMHYHVPEPVVFYYYTGVKTLWGNNHNATDANWYIRVDNGHLVIDSVANRQALQDTIAVFKKLGISL